MVIRIGCLHHCLFLLFFAVSAVYKDCYVYGLYNLIQYNIHTTSVGDAINCEIVHLWVALHSVNLADLLNHKYKCQRL